jgi:hypothetical protein
MACRRMQIANQLLVVFVSLLILACGLLIGRYSVQIINLVLTLQLDGHQVGALLLEKGYFPSLMWPNRDALSGVDLSSIYTIHSIDQAEVSRRRLVTYIWGIDKLDQSTDAEEFRTNNIKIGKLRSDLNLRFFGKYGFVGDTWYFASQRSSPTCLVVYNQGHTNEIMSQKEGFVERDLLEKLNVICDIILTTLPFNNDSSISGRTRFGQIRTNRHDALPLFRSLSFNPLSYFFDPIRTSINWALHRKHYVHTFMIGFSGGGWLTTFYSALDPRIDMSFSVAGSWPFFLRVLDPLHRSWGDWEQSATEIYEVVDYPDIYLLSSSGQRSSRLLYNYYDDCCYGGDGPLAYRLTLKSAAQAIGGDLDIEIDHTGYGHSISGRSSVLILFAIERRISAVPSSGVND